MNFVRDWHSSQLIYIFTEKLVSCKQLKCSPHVSIVNVDLENGLSPGTN